MHKLPLSFRVQATIRFWCRKGTVCTVHTAHCTLHIKEHLTLRMFLTFLYKNLCQITSASRINVNFICMEFANAKHIFACFFLSSNAIYSIIVKLKSDELHSPDPYKLSM